MRAWPHRVLLAVPLAWVAVAHVGPLLSMVRISLLAAYPAPLDSEPEWSPAAYTSFLAHPSYPTILARSLALAAAATLVSLLLAYPLAYYVALRVPSNQRSRRLALLIAPFWASEVLRIFALQLLLANRGAINGVLRWLGVTEAPVAMLYGHGAVLLGLTYTVLLTMLLPLYAALDRLPADLLETAADLGASGWQRFWTVTLPLTARGVAAGVALTFLASLGVFAAPALLGGPSSSVFTIVITDMFGVAGGRWPVGAAFGLILLVAGTAGALGLAVLVPGLRPARAS